MRSLWLPVALLLAGIATLAHAQDDSQLYPFNREPLLKTPMTALPLSAVKPQGWLKDQLTVQANGLTGHLDEFWPSLTQTAWKGHAKGEDWERGPYFLDGLVPLAYLLEDPRLIDKVKSWIEPILASGQPDGWFGPPSNKDRWPRAVALKVLTQYHEATGDPRVIPLIQNYFKWLHVNPPDWPDKEWRGVRAMENVVSAYWLYNRTGDKTILEVAKSIHDNSFDWVGYFLNFPYTDEALAKGLKYSHPTHVVNIAMAIKHPGVWYQQSKDARDREALYAGLAALDKYHGQVGGRFAGDEHLSGRKPTQGTELCAVVEYMYSLEKLCEVFDDVTLSDRLEQLAYNANPGASTADYWAHQYDQQANQVLCSIAKRAWSTNNDTSNLFGLEPNFGCCTANMHQGWPKFVSHMWMATPDRGLAAVTYGPNKVTAKAGDGATVTITQVTDYPFEGSVKMTVETSAETKFPLHLRIPSWAKGAKLTVGGQAAEARAGAFAVVDRTWKSGDVVTLELPMELRTETRYNDAVAIHRGPLVFSLRIGQKLTKLKSYHEKLPVADWQIEPATPWNYGLVIDPKNPGASITVESRRPSRIPFSDERPAVVLRAKGRAIPEWTMERSSAGETPKSPVVSNEPVTELELVPYGSTRLRITEFPVIANPQG